MAPALDAVAKMYKAGILDARGARRNGHPNVRGTGKTLQFVLADARASGHE
ncbi:MAG: hypothetical protein ACUVRJ_02230 [Candidatus Villigracilaceae bacterium]